MSSSDSEGEKTLSRRQTILKGADNFKEWEHSILAQLIQKDLDDVIQSDAQTPVVLEERKAWEKEDRKAWAAIDESIDSSIHNVLPPHLLDITSSSASSPSGLKAKSLYDHLRLNYPAARSTRKAELYRIIWHTDIEEANPITSISAMRRAYNDLTASSVSMADSQHMLGDPSSSEVISAINDEFRRRQTQETSTLALAAKLPKSSTQAKWNRQR
ncbi:hypothetical protein TREMEDRAFT_66358 [Tremella mesenterica DSM 1558]|uniref:uncharacterized protein n=1 Tax=Tremella mesenterica (strain ATCC 24925 / CBS 8224 / DSM 1558 / NBRC 9311 / NRRL Y-6157 / RJB 2259-6 / UBC 559-6) TaxID=578456 RepID=UPI00032BCB4A|nr:uncharacterized protein TREMEDRAFT_66358 [Tremella mesenterica DSM 1558]EIW65635.1 hypothetical protein TREMEDRAFT_66358 [Tremella mesenterica DSM 1558]